MLCVIRLRESHLERTLRVRSNAASFIHFVHRNLPPHLFCTCRDLELFSCEMHAAWHGYILGALKCIPNNVRVHIYACACVFFPRVQPFSNETHQTQWDDEEEKRWKRKS